MSWQKRLKPCPHIKYVTLQQFLFPFSTKPKTRLGWYFLQIIVSCIYAEKHFKTIGTMTEEIELQAHSFIERLETVSIQRFFAWAQLLVFSRDKVVDKDHNRCLTSSHRKHKLCSQAQWMAPHRRWHQYIRLCTMFVLTCRIQLRNVLSYG